MRVTKHEQDEMTPVQRRKALEEGGTLDRIPVIPFIGELTGRLTGTNTVEYWHDSRKMAASELAAFCRWGHDELSCGPNTIGISEAMGAHIAYPETGMPYFAEHFVTDYAMLDSMEPMHAKNERMRFFQEALEQIKEGADGRCLSEHWRAVYDCSKFARL